MKGTRQNFHSVHSEWLSNRGHYFALPRFVFLVALVRLAPRDLDDTLEAGPDLSRFSRRLDE